jgi:hypothetical protein
MRTILHLGDRPITLEFRSFEDEVDVDDLLKIHYDNIFSDAITIPALQNQIGLLRAEVEQNYNKTKFECEIYEAERRKEIRSEYSKNELKLTEKQLDEEIILDKPFQIKKKSVFNAKKNFDFVDSLFWACSSKSKKLDNLVKGVTPEELANEIIECTINNIIIRKPKGLGEK